MGSARESILGRVRRALGRDPDPAAVQRYIEAHRHGPRPTMPDDLVGRFLQRAQDMASTVARVASREDVPDAVARYLAAEGLEGTGVCWPELADLPWVAHGLALEPRPSTGRDRLGVTGAFCAIAETGTLVLLSGREAHTASALLPETHVAVLAAARIVSGMEEAFALIRAERGALPRAINMISGPSRTGDIEQTIVLGAHGPFRMHVVVVG